MELVVSPTGTVTAIYDEVLDLHAIGRPHIVRASHVEPDADGRWFAAIVDGPTLGPFARRSDAIAAEVEWLCEHRLSCPVEIPFRRNAELPRVSQASGSRPDPQPTGPMPASARPIRAGQVVRILPTYQDPGDEEIQFIAIDDESNGRILVEIQIDLPIKPTQIVFSHMIDRTAVET